jgi:hypothetical protein
VPPTFSTGIMLRTVCYVCPLTGVTVETDLKVEWGAPGLIGREVQLDCPCCGEEHLLSQVPFWLADDERPAG